MDSLFGYPGNKRKMVKSLEYVSSSVFCDPFVGAGSFTLHQYAKHPTGKFFIADTDPAIQSVFLACQYNRQETIYETQHLIKKFLDKPDQTWEFIKNTLGKQKISMRTAVCKLLYQRIAHGSIPRTCADGVTPNVIWSLDKSKGLATWQVDLPDLSNCDLQFHQSYQEALIACPENAIIFLDPPYYAPGKSACYPGHRPNSIITLKTILNAIALAIPKSKQLIITHYECDAIDQLLTNYENLFTIDKTVGSTLNSLNYGQGNYNHGLREEKKVVYRDCVWSMIRK